MKHKYIYIDKNSKKNPFRVKIKGKHIGRFQDINVAIEKRDEFLNIRETKDNDNQRYIDDDLKVNLGSLQESDIPW